MRSLLCLFALVAGQASAQVCVTGVIETAPAISVCQQRLTHRLSSTRVHLISSTIDLNRYLGQNVRVTGRDVGVTCTVLDVSRVDPPPAELSWCGSGSTGCPLKLKVCPAGVGRYWLFLGLRVGFRPLGCGGSAPIDGSLLVQEPIIPLVGGNLGAGCGELTLPVPLDNALVGVSLFFQAARQDIGPVGPLELTNLGFVRLTPLMPPCAPTNC